MKVAVSGGTGFIGSYVLNELANRHIDHTVLTRKPAFFHSIYSKTLVHDINSDSKDIYNMLGRPDVLVHLAWSGLPNYRSLHHVEVELPRQYQFLKRMISSGLPNLIVAGTCFEYGLTEGPLREDVPANPILPYAYAKSALYRQLMFFKETHPFNLTWARLFYLFGDGQAKSSLYSQIRADVSAGAAFFNMSGGEQLRDFLPVTLAARYLVDLSLSNQDLGIVNVCSGIPVSVRSIVERWIAENSWSIRPNLGYYPYPSYEPMAFWGDSKYLLSVISP